MVNTTDFAEVYNVVLRGAGALPFIGIIEFVLYCIRKYFLERATAVHITMENIQMVYSTKMTEFLDTTQKGSSS